MGEPGGGRSGVKCEEGEVGEVLAAAATSEGWGVNWWREEEGMGEGEGATERAYELLCRLAD